MTTEYTAYLESPEWRNKRAQRLEISNGQCSACGKKRDLQVHHLTYERIFHEDMADLLPLCREHHDEAEALIKKRKLFRRGHPLFLATETIRLLSKTEPVNTAPKGSKSSRKEARKARYDNLTSEQWFVAALKLPSRKQFKKQCREMIPQPQRCKLMPTCVSLWMKKHVYKEIYPLPPHSNQQVQVQTQ